MLINLVVYLGSYLIKSSTLFIRSQSSCQGFSVVTSPSKIYLSSQTVNQFLLQHGLLASGGGTADRNIRFWNVLTGQCIQHVDTGSQVCNLAWSNTSTELVSTHGYSQNQIIIWRYPSLIQVAKLTGHTTRVLYLVSILQDISGYFRIGQDIIGYFRIVRIFQDTSGYYRIFQNNLGYFRICYINYCYTIRQCHLMVRLL